MKKKGRSILRIYNTLTRRKEELKTITDGEVKIYACGPTVYNYIHIGNSRPLCVFDTLRRYLEYRGYKVNFVQNFTDIDDKIIKKAIEENSDYKTVSEKYIKEFWTDAKGLNFREATVHPKATENIDEIINIISTLVEKGYAYPVENGDVYFSPKKFSGYGKLSHQPLEELEAGARINIGELKREPMDFALWKGAKPGEPYWESPWGKGRPGWHIECSAISMKHLGEYLDLHCGGVDNIFPHHTNEIAQSEAAVGHPWCSHWFHVQHLNDREGKMSKSKGNILTVSVLQEKGYDPLVYRMFCLQSHYRKPLEFSYDTLDNSKAAYERLLNRIAGIPQEGETNAAQFEDYRRRFIEKVGNDLNTSLGLTVLYDLLKDSDVNGATKRAIIADFDRVLSLNLLSGGTNTAEEHSDEFVRYVEGLIRERAEAKKNKNYARADEIRAELAEKGVTLKDSKEGTSWTKA